MAYVKARPEDNPSPEDLNALVALFNEARYVEAATLAEAVTRRFPRHPFAWKVLGATLKQLGRNADALAPAHKAVALSPGDAQAHSNLGAVLSDLGQLAEAVASYRRAVEIEPGFVQAHHNLGVTLKNLGHLTEAVASCRRALEINPDYVEAHNNLGAVLSGLGRHADAMASYRRALELKPDYAEAHNNLGVVLNDRGQLVEAVASYRRAVEIKPGFVQAYYNLGVTLKHLGQLAEAAASCRRALNLKPDFAEAHNNLGGILKDLEQLAEAAASYRRALEFKPDYAEAHSNLGNVLKDLGQLAEAVASHRRALQIKPDFAEAHSNLGVALKDLGQLTEAVANYRKALELKPDFAHAHSNLIQGLLYDVGHDAEVIEVELRQWNRQHAVPLAPFILPHTNDRSPERRLRIGYVSNDFVQHPVGFFLLPLLGAHDRERFHVSCYTTNSRTDDVTLRLQARANEWRNLAGASDDDIARQIREDRIDLLVDLSGHTGGNLLPVFARKPAPVQVSYLGFPAGTGLGTIDYRLTDRWADPLGATGVTEQLVRLPETAWCFSPLSGSPPVGELPAAHCRHVTFGCFNNFAKVTEEMLRLWVRILQRVPESRLVLKNLAVGNYAVAQRLHALFAQQGIGTDRLKLLSRTQSSLEHLQCYHGIDLALDTFPYHGTTTTCEALWMGVPVITLAGSRHVARVGVSLLSNVGLPELVADSVEDYVEKAVALANDRSRLAALRAGLRERMQRSPLMDAPRFARNMESAYRAMWRQWCGRPDANISTASPSV
jgi:protein O-GlcNAc transferase